MTTSKALQSKFDVWAGNWLGRKRRAAMKKAAAEIQDMNKEEHSRIKEVFQLEKYNFIARSWKPLDMVLCADPSVNCDDLFDPVVAEHNAGSHWIVDNSLAGIDQNGWTYAYDVKTLNQTGSGNPLPQWNSLVRRRKWRHVERASVSSASGIKGIVARSDARAVKLAANNKHVDKIGYVPRNKQAVGMNASGLSSAGMMGKNRKDPDQVRFFSKRSLFFASYCNQRIGVFYIIQVLDEDTAAGLSRVEERNSEIDAGIDTIARGIDNLASISAAMKDEVSLLFTSPMLCDVVLYLRCIALFLLDHQPEPEAGEDWNSYAEGYRKTNGC